MHIKKGDNVIVLAGDNKGKEGKVTKLFLKRNLVLVDGVNQKQKHQKARQQGKKGQVVTISMPIHASNVRLASKKVKSEKAKKTEKK